MLPLPSHPAHPRGERPLLQVQNLTQVYPSGTAVEKDISFDCADGEFRVVIGISGSGKSTLLYCINRLIEPTSGRLLWDGQDIPSAAPAELRTIRRQIGMVFQQFNLVRRLSVLTNVLSRRRAAAGLWRRRA